MTQRRTTSDQIQTIIGISGTVAVFLLILLSANWMKPVEQKQPRMPNIAEPIGIGVFESLPGDSEAIAVVQVAQVASAKGEPHYQQFCASCHGLPGAKPIPGQTGSDLFDGVSTIPFTRDAIASTIKMGILDKGMLPMSAVLSETQVEELALYLLENQRG